MKKLFESKKSVYPIDTIVTTPDAKIILTKAPFIDYKQILLEKNFRQYLETIMVSKRSCVWGCKKHHTKNIRSSNGF